MAIVKGANGAVLGVTLSHGIYTGKHKRCIVCAKKAMRDGLLDESLCETCNEAFDRWFQGPHGCHAGVIAWIARRVRAHERKQAKKRENMAWEMGRVYGK